MVSTVYILYGSESNKDEDGDDDDDDGDDDDDDGGGVATCCRRGSRSLAVLKVCVDWHVDASAEIEVGEASGA